MINPRPWAEVLRDCDLPAAFAAPDVGQSGPEPVQPAAQTTAWWGAKYVVAKSGDVCHPGSWVFVQVRTKHGEGDHPVRQDGRTADDGVREPVPSSDSNQGDVNADFHDQEPTVHAGRIRGIVIPAFPDGSTHSNKAAVIFEHYDVLDETHPRWRMPVLTPSDGEATGELSIISVQV